MVSELGIHDWILDIQEWLIIFGENDVEYVGMLSFFPNYWYKCTQPMYVMWRNFTINLHN